MLIESMFDHSLVMKQIVLITIYLEHEKMLLEHFNG